MGKLVFVVVVFVIGIGLYSGLRRQADRLPAAARRLVPTAVLLLAIGIPAAILIFSVFRVIPAGHVGVKVGVADALRIKGEAEAAYNTRVASSLTPALIQQQYLVRWDGRLPQYTLGGNVVPFLPVPSPAGDGARR